MMRSPLLNFTVKWIVTSSGGPFKMIAIVYVFRSSGITNLPEIYRAGGRSYVITGTQGLYVIVRWIY